jgi:hypothetical protein
MVIAQPRPLPLLPLSAQTHPGTLLLSYKKTIETYTYITLYPPEVGKVTLKSNGDEVLSDESP